MLTADMATSDGRRVALITGITGQVRLNIYLIHRRQFNFIIASYSKRSVLIFI